MEEHTSPKVVTIRQDMSMLKRGGGYYHIGCGLSEGRSEERLGEGKVKIDRKSWWQVRTLNPSAQKYKYLDSSFSSRATVS